MSKNYTSICMEKKIVNEIKKFVGVNKPFSSVLAFVKVALKEQLLREKRHSTMKCERRLNGLPCDCNLYPNSDDEYGF